MVELDENFSDLIKLDEKMIKLDEHMIDLQICKNFFQQKNRIFLVGKKLFFEYFWQKNFFPT